MVTHNKKLDNNDPQNRMFQQRKMKQKEKELCNKHYIVVLRNEEGKLQTAF